MRKFNSSKPKKKEICIRCTWTCKNEDGSALIECDDFKEIKVEKEK